MSWLPQALCCRSELFCCTYTRGRCTVLGMMGWIPFSEPYLGSGYVSFSPRFPHISEGSIILSHSGISCILFWLHTEVEAEDQVCITHSKLNPWFQAFLLLSFSFQKMAPYSLWESSLSPFIHSLNPLQHQILSAQLLKYILNVTIDHHLQCDHVTITISRWFHYNSLLLRLSIVNVFSSNPFSTKQTDKFFFFNINLIMSFCSLKSLKSH